MYSKDLLSLKLKTVKINQTLRNQRRIHIKIGTRRITGIIKPMPLTEIEGEVNIEVITEVAEAMAMVMVEVPGINILFDCEMY